MTQPAAASLRVPGEQAELMAWVREHRVSWEVVPHFEVEDQCRRLVALDLCLSAAPSRRCDGSPGCGECARVHERLCALASSALPAGSDFRLGPFDGCFHLRRENDWRPEILLTVELRARPARAESMEEATRAIVGLMERRLLAFGAQRELWREPRRVA